MNNKLIRKVLTVVMVITTFVVANAQIGYQVALINNATGEPRALETVSVEISITDKPGKTIYSSTETTSTNDFGIISLTVGNTDTFKDMDWTKLPLYISAKVDGILIGKTQILNVPVAEYAKTTGVLTAENLCKAPFLWKNTDNYGSIWNYSLTFYEDGTGKDHQFYKSPDNYISTDTYPFRWYIDSNFITIVYDDKADGDRGFLLKYIPEIDAISMGEHIYTR
ncbi:MAG: hypothetical protein K2M10_06895 [Muribaculaceae bacterium]|nr:hypothetical protein [Muribaculaceae bacterium]MDE6299353.1 hypothetical protein [Muribaculaceae bacterium]